MRKIFLSVIVLIMFCQADLAIGKDAEIQIQGTAFNNSKQFFWSEIFNSPYAMVMVGRVNGKAEYLGANHSTQGAFVITMKPYDHFDVQVGTCCNHTTCHMTFASGAKDIGLINVSSSGGIKCYFKGTPGGNNFTLTIDYE